MTTEPYDESFLDEFNEFYGQLAIKINSDKAFDQTLPDSKGKHPSGESYTREIIDYYKDKGWWKQIESSGFARLVLAVIAPPKNVLQHINYGTTLLLFRQLIESIGDANKHSLREEAKIYYGHIQRLDRQINGQTKSQIQTAFNEAIQLEDSPEERLVLPKENLKKLLNLHLDSFDVKTRHDLQKIMQGGSLGGLLAMIIFWGAVLVLLFFFRESIAYGDNVLGNLFRNIGDSLNMDPVYILYLVFLAVFAIILVSIFSYARKAERRSRFVRSTRNLMETLEVEESTFNEIIDERYYGEKVKLKEQISFK